MPYTMTPPLPDWKPADDPDEDGQAGPYDNLPPPPNPQQQVRWWILRVVAAARWPSMDQSAILIRPPQEGLGL